ncbi:uncharacterized protein LOC143185148 [Calliopsis andreniformis]|uniref:uncharacterized protein LOC143185148 n=1 Tax=Calliopsis andreniformis TaxID=337506 RepID=UPI003FCE5870
MIGGSYRKKPSANVCFDEGKEDPKKCRSEITRKRGLKAGEKSAPPQRVSLSRHSVSLPHGWTGRQGGQVSSSAWKLPERGWKRGEKRGEKLLETSILPLTIDDPRDLLGGTPRTKRVLDAFPGRVSWTRFLDAFPGRVPATGQRVCTRRLRSILGAIRSRNAMDGTTLVRDGR